MAKARAETVIGEPADVVWARIRDFGDVSWIPNTDTWRLDGDVRTVTMKGQSFQVSQRLLEHDDEGRTYRYCMAETIDLSPLLGPGHVVEHLEGTIAVTPEGTSSRVTFDVDTHDFMVAAVNAEYQGALDNLKALLEG
jgi:hypothetical protein